MNSSFTCVPGVVAADPWENSVEGREEVKKCPGQDDDVICHHEDGNHLNPVANTLQINKTSAVMAAKWALLAMLPHEDEYLPLKDKFFSNRSARPDPWTGPRILPGRSRGFQGMPGKKCSKSKRLLQETILPHVKTKEIEIQTQSATLPRVSLSHRLRSWSTDRETSKRCQGQWFLQLWPKWTPSCWPTVLASDTLVRPSGPDCPP